MKRVLIITLIIFTNNFLIGKNYYIGEFLKNKDFENDLEVKEGY